MWGMEGDCWGNHNSVPVTLWPAKKWTEKTFLKIFPDKIWKKRKKVVTLHRWFRHTYLLKRMKCNRAELFLILNLLWNTTNKLKIPQLLNSPTGKWIINTHIDPKRFYAVACCTAYWLNSIDPANTFIKDIKRLLRKYRIVDPVAMGFPSGWKKEPIWK